MVLFFQGYDSINLKCTFFTGHTSSGLAAQSILNTKLDLLKYGSTIKMFLEEKLAVIIINY